MAKKWLSQYGGNLYDKKADVLAHFKKDPANLPIRWEQYHNEFAHRVENTKIRLDNGFQIPEVQQNNLIGSQCGSSPRNESCGNGGERGDAGASPSPGKN